METEKLGIAVVTGSSTGIGFASALELARRGYRVFAGMRNTAKAEPLTKIAEQEDLGITVVPMDVTSAASCDAAFADVRQSGPIDVLVNNAGIGGATPLELTPEHEHRAIFETNYFGAVRCVQAVLHQNNWNAVAVPSLMSHLWRAWWRCPTKFHTPRRNGRWNA